MSFLKSPVNISAPFSLFFSFKYFAKLPDCAASTKVFIRARSLLILHAAPKAADGIFKSSYSTIPKNAGIPISFVISKIEYLLQQWLNEECTSESTSFEPEVVISTLGSGDFESHAIEKKSRSITSWRQLRIA